MSELYADKHKVTGSGAFAKEPSVLITVYRPLAVDADGRDVTVEPLDGYRDFTAVGDGGVWCRVSGSGPPLLLITPVELDSRIWAFQASPFKGQLRVIEFDLPGTGKSPARTGGDSLTHIAVKLLDSLKIGRCSILGISGGAQIALDVALAIPDRLSALILVAPMVNRIGSRLTPEQIQSVLPRLAEKWSFAVDPMRHRDWEALAILLMDQPWYRLGTANAEARDLLKSVLVENFSLQREKRLGESADFVDPPTIDRLGEIRCPTLLVIGERDDEQRHLDADDLLAGIAQARKVVVPDAPQLVNLDQPEVFNQLVLDFLAEVDRERTA